MLDGSLARFLGKLPREFHELPPVPSLAELEDMLTCYSNDSPPATTRIIVQEAEVTRSLRVSTVCILLLPIKAAACTRIKKMIYALLC